MTDLIALLQRNGWEGRPGAGEAELEAVERLVGVPLPADLKDILGWSDGGKGWIRVEEPRFFFWLLGTAEIAQQHRDGFCTVSGVVLIGSDGSREHFALDFRGDPGRPRLVAVDLTCQDEPGAVIAVGTSFGHGLRRLAAGESYFSQPAEP